MIVNSTSHFNDMAISSCMYAGQFFRDGVEVDAVEQQDL